MKKSARSTTGKNPITNKEFYLLRQVKPMEFTVVSTHPTRQLAIKEKSTHNVVLGNRIVNGLFLVSNLDKWSHSGWRGREVDSKGNINRMTFITVR